MDKYRKKMDSNILENLKSKIYYYLKNNDLNAEFFKNNMDSIKELYVENPIEIGDYATIVSRAPAPDRPAEIMIDKQFVEMDEFDNPIRIKPQIKDWVYCQIVNKLLYAATRYDGITGIMTNKNNRGLNEGLTQMIAEEILGYSVIDVEEYKYQNSKNISKILYITFGEEIILDSYFNHSYKLEIACNDLANDKEFYMELNNNLSDMYKIEKNLQEEDIPLYDDIKELVFKKICAQIILNNLELIQKNDQIKYLYEVLEAVKNDKTYKQQVSDIINDYKENEDVTIEVLAKDETEIEPKHELDIELNEEIHDEFNPKSVEFVDIDIKEDINLNTKETIVEEQIIKELVTEEPKTEIIEDIIELNIQEDYKKGDNIDKIITPPTMLIQLTKAGITQSKIANSEIAVATEEMSRIFEIQRLQALKQNGEELTEEEENRIAEYLAKMSQAEMLYQQLFSKNDDDE